MAVDAPRPQANGTVVLVGGPRRKRMLGPLGHVVRATLASKLGRQTAKFFIAKPNGSDLASLRRLIESGQMKPVIEERFAFARINDAMPTMSDGHARAKIVVTI